MLKYKISRKCVQFSFCEKGFNHDLDVVRHSSPLYWKSSWLRPRLLGTSPDWVELKGRGIVTSSASSGTSPPFRDGGRWGISEWDRQTGECYYLFIHCINRRRVGSSRDCGIWGGNNGFGGGGREENDNDLPGGVSEMGFAGVLWLGLAILLPVKLRANGVAKVLLSCEWIGKCTWRNRGIIKL